MYATIGNQKIPTVVITDRDGNITVSYHGTDFIHGYQDLLSDLNMLHKKVDDIGINGNAHRGFLDRYLQSRGALNDILNNIEDKEGRSLTMTGHSLGGALATVGAADWANKNKNKKTFKDIRSIVFGSPQVFDQTATNHVNALLHNNFFRIYKDYDPVTYQMPGLEDVGQGLVLPGRDSTSLQNHYLKNLNLGHKEWKRPTMRVKDKLYNNLQSVVETITKTLNPFYLFRK